MPWGSTRTNSHVMRERDEMERDKCLGAPLALIVDVMRERETNKQSSRETVRWGSALCVSLTGCERLGGRETERRRERQSVCEREGERDTEGGCMCVHVRVRVRVCARVPFCLCLRERERSRER